MYVRDAKNREEVWLLEHIESMGLDDTAFRSRDYVVAIDEESGAKAGFGRIRVHKGESDSDTDGERSEVCELTSIGVVENWRQQGVGAHVIERLVEYASDEGFDTVYALSGESEYLAQFGFRRIAAVDLSAPLEDRLEKKRGRIDPDAVPMELEIDQFELADRFREAFKEAAPRREEQSPEESPEDFGIDSESATYKYDTGR